MHSTGIFLSTLGAKIAPFIVDSAVKGAVWILLAATVARALSKASAATRHLVWCCALGGLLLLPMLTAILPGWQVCRRGPANCTDARTPYPSRTCLRDRRSARCRRRCRRRSWNNELKTTARWQLQVRGLRRNSHLPGPSRPRRPALLGIFFSFG
jgi:hypothetical protein